MLGQFAPGQDPGLNSGPNVRTRQIIVLMLRLGLGITLLNDGLTGFLQQRMPGRFAFAAGVPMSQGMAFEAARTLPYAEIVIGVALLFGFLTAISTFAAMGLQLVYHLVETLSLFLFQGMSTPFQAQFIGMSSSVRLLILLTGAVMLWLSTTVRDLFSIDTLVFRPSYPAYAGEPPIRNRPAPLPLEPRPTRGGTDAYLGVPPTESPADPPSTD